jgi:hypothetical protein
VVLHVVGAEAAAAEAVILVRVVGALPAKRALVDVLGALEGGRLGGALLGRLLFGVRAERGALVGCLQDVRVLGAGLRGRRAGRGSGERGGGGAAQGARRRRNSTPSTSHASSSVIFVVIVGCIP